MGKFGSFESYLGLKNRFLDKFAKILGSEEIWDVEILKILLLQKIC